MLLQTTTTKQNAGVLINEALHSGLSVCVQQISIQSHYFWRVQQEQDLKVCNEEEILLSFKVFKHDFKALHKLILQHHSYEIPEIIGLKLHQISKVYKKWCKETKANFV